MAARRISIEECRRLFGGVSNAELADIRNKLYPLAEVIVGAYVEHTMRNAHPSDFDRALNDFSPEEIEDAVERAAIKQFDGNNTRAAAEKEAVTLVLEKRRKDDGGT